MLSNKPKQVKKCLDDSSEDDGEHQTLFKYIDPNILETLDSQRNANKLMQLFPDVQHRINILKQLQLEAANIEANFFAEVHALECKYHQLYAPIYEKRSQVVAGTYELRDQEAQWPPDDENESLEAQLKNDVKMEEEEDSEIEDKPDPTGIPNFWLTVFQNVNCLFERVQPQDKPILSHLQDIKVDCSENPMSFTLSFYFSPNKYFTNSVLTKQYFMKCEPGKDFFNFEGPEIYKCKGCHINWNKGMNMTLKTVIKKERHKSLGVIRTIIRTVENKSFFNFFAPPELPENVKDEKIDKDLRQLLISDFEVGQYIRERIVPKAILLYLDETVQDEDDEYENYDPDDTTLESESDKEQHDRAARDVNCEQQ